MTSCINGPDGMTAEVQCELFEAVLDEIGKVRQLVNEAVEVDLESLDDEFTIHRYPIPRKLIDRAAFGFMGQSTRLGASTWTRIHRYGSSSMPTNTQIEDSVKWTSERRANPS